MHYDRDYRGLTQSYGVDKLNLYGHGFSSHNLQFKFLKIFLRVGPAHMYLVDLRQYVALTYLKSSTSNHGAWRNLFVAIIFNIGYYIINL
jgi:hypothetical protein